jgi:hypothetical protein
VFLDDCESIDISDLIKAGGSRRSRRRLRSCPLLDVVTGAVGIEIIDEGRRTEVDLSWTSCNYGGERPWFICPSCERRAKKLFSVERVWRCRSCAGLRYRSQHEDVLSRRLRRSSRLRRRLGGATEVHGPLPDKPPFMQWHTYDRHLGEIVAAENPVAAEVLGDAELTIAKFSRAIAKLSR